MKIRTFAWCALAVALLAIGFFRLRLDVDVLDLLPDSLGSVHGLKLYQRHFTNSRELLITVHSADSQAAESAAQAIADNLSRETNLVENVTWRAPWMEHPDLAAEMIAYLWLNQPPAVFQSLASRLTATNLDSVLEDTRTRLSTSLSPADLAQLSYDPYGFTRLPDSISSIGAGFGNGQEVFASSDGTFRLLFVKSKTELHGYQECTDWLNSMRGIAEKSVSSAVSTNSAVTFGYTGRPAFEAEISASMKHDMIVSIAGTSAIIALLFWLAHRRLKPMLWLLTLLAVILTATLALGGLIYGTVNIISLGFAGILLGLAVDYAVVHYQEALAHPNLIIPQIRSAIAPSIFWAATTTIVAFLMLNLGGLPGLAQLGTLVGVGMAISALVMIFAYLPPLFPDRRRPEQVKSPEPSALSAKSSRHPLNDRVAIALTCILAIGCVCVLIRGLPEIDTTADTLQPRNSQAYATLEQIKTNLSQQTEPLWLIVEGRDESTVKTRLDAIQPALDAALANHTLAKAVVPVGLWPSPGNQASNHSTARHLLREREALRSAALAGGFTEEALGLTKQVLDVWQRSIATPGVFWPTNQMSQWIFRNFAARSDTNLFAAGYLYPAAESAAQRERDLDELQAALPKSGVWLSGWELLGEKLLGVVRGNLWKLLGPMVALVLGSLWLAFRHWREVVFSVCILALSGLCLLAVMRLMGWSWNLLNLMGMPLILGTGVDYSIFTQLALRRHHGDMASAYRSVGRALLLCGGTAVAGFSSLALSSNAGMASLGQVCAVGVACNMLISVFLLPVWWKRSSGKTLLREIPAETKQPSSLYKSRVWSLGLAIAGCVPRRLCLAIAPWAALLYSRLADHRRRIVMKNLLPVLNNDAAAAGKATKELFREFALKLVDLWYFESGVPVRGWITDWEGWECFEAAHSRRQGVLLVTPHLGNWEFGGAFLAERGIDLLVLTQAEPDEQLTRQRQESRSLHGIQTLVIGQDPFAFVEIIKRLQAGTTVALLIDRPPAASAAKVRLFSREFEASIAAAELARAAGAAILPAYIVRSGYGYRARILPEIQYNRAMLCNREARTRLTEEILRVFEPAIREYASQWFHFVPVWPDSNPA